MKPYQWPAAVRYAVYLKNRSPTRANPEMACPYQIVFKKKPKDPFPHSFGDICFSNLSVERKEREVRNKFGARAVKAIFIGIPETFDGIYVLHNNGTLIRRDVRFPTNQQGVNQHKSTEVVQFGFEGSRTGSQAHADIECFA